jgi:hypothetical protein
MRPLRWQVRELSDPRYLDTAIARLGWTLEALREDEVGAARALVAGLYGEWEGLRDRCIWRIVDKEVRS